MCGGLRTGGSVVGEGGERLLTSGQVARLFKVHPKTVARWETAGHLGAIRTPGRHRRFLESDVLALLAASSDEPVGAA